MDKLLSENPQSFITNHTGLCSLGLKEKTAGNVSNIQENVTSYGRMRYSPDKVKDVHNELTHEFLKFFQEKGYQKLESVGINSGIDSSVYFIGAPISVMKPYLVSRTIPASGLVMTQPSLRTRNAKTISNREISHNWGSFFTGISTLVDYPNSNKLLRESIEFLLQRLRIPKDNIQIHISTQDSDMVTLLRRVGCTIELIFDAHAPKYYDHKYGLGSIIGRNFNFALKEHSSGEFKDIGNFIIIENGVDKYGVELAFGIETIMKEIYELNHVLETSVIEVVFPGNGHPIRQKLQDAIITSIAILKSGVRPNSSNTKGRVLKAYIEGIKTNAQFLGMSTEELHCIMTQYELAEYGNKGECAEFVMRYISYKS